MQQNRLFRKTRTSIAIWYAGVMGSILGLLGIGVYKAIEYTHQRSVDRELESVAGTLHDSLELKLTKSGSIDAIIYQLLPNLCLANTNCKPHNNNYQPRHILSAVSKGEYYVRFYDRSGNLIAVAGDYPQNLQSDFNATYWQTLRDSKNHTYHQISFVLHTKSQQDWGYFQVGRTLEDVEKYLTRVAIILQIGLPIAILFVTIASWYLAGSAMQPIYRSYRQIEQFTADAAHELRTPLAAIQATIESVIKNDLEPKEASQILDRIDRDNRRLIQLVADLLLLSRFDRQTITASFQPCCLNDLVNDLVEELDILAIQNQITLNADLRVKKEVFVLGNCDQLYRLVYNLIINAIQYTPAAGTITVSLYCQENSAFITVKDTGIGITKEQQKKIFDRFYRVDNARSRHTGGSGLGLSIASAITKLHRGSLEVQSKIGEGSIFILRLSTRDDSATCKKSEYVKYKKSLVTIESAADSKQQRDIQSK
jgi:signal transduction histidine kinase